MKGTEREERRPRQDGAPVQETHNFGDNGTTTAWWSKPPHLITVEHLDAVADRVRRAAGVLEVAAGVGAEVVRVGS